MTLGDEIELSVTVHVIRMFGCKRDIYNQNFRKRDTVGSRYLFRCINIRKIIFVEFDNFFVKLKMKQTSIWIHAIKLLMIF